MSVAASDPAAANPQELHRGTQHALLDARNMLDGLNDRLAQPLRRAATKEEASARGMAIASVRFMGARIVDEVHELLERAAQYAGDDNAGAVQKTLQRVPQLLERMPCAYPRTRMHDEYQVVVARIDAALHPTGNTINAPSTLRSALYTVAVVWQRFVWLLTSTVDDALT